MYLKHLCSWKCSLLLLTAQLYNITYFCNRGLFFKTKSYVIDFTCWSIPPPSIHLKKIAQGKPKSLVEEITSWRINFEFKYHKRTKLSKPDEERNSLLCLNILHSNLSSSPQQTLSNSNTWKQNIDLVSLELNMLSSGCFVGYLKHSCVITGLSYGAFLVQNIISVSIIILA
jgi:hypothetical protein